MVLETKAAQSSVPRATEQAKAKAHAQRRLLPFLLGLTDALLIYAAFALAYWVRYSLKIGPHISSQIDFHAYQPLALLAIGIMMTILLFKGAYRTRMASESVHEFAAIFSASTLTLASIEVIKAMLHQFEYSRAVVVYVWILTIVLVSAGRILYRFLQSIAHRHGWGVRRLLVIGATESGKMVMQSVMSRPDLGYELVGFVEHREVIQARDFGRFRVLGGLADVAGLLNSEAVDEVIVALPASAHEQAWPILRECGDQGIGVKVVPDMFDTSLSRVQIDGLNGIPLLDVQEKPLRRVERIAKRVIDVLLASILLAGSLPLLLVLGLLIRQESPGPALVRQRRIGLRGRPFVCFKLRTMRVDAPALQASVAHLNESDGPIFKIRNDPRCTPRGRIIRRWSLDELPQLWNVVRGDMSLVGPRPPLPNEAARYDQQHMRRLEVKPGMTGLWQVSGRSDLHFDEMVVMDISYVDYWTLTLDMKILVRTAIAVLTRHGAY